MADQDPDIQQLPEQIQARIPDQGSIPTNIPVSTSRVYIVSSDGRLARVVAAGSVPLLVGGEPDPQEVLRYITTDTVHLIYHKRVFVDTGLFFNDVETGYGILRVFVESPTARQIA